MALEISGISAIPSQEFQFRIEDGTINISLIYKAAIEMWFMDVVYAKRNFSVNSLRVCNNPNLLDEYINILPFGILISNNTNEGYEPSSIDDFSSNRYSIAIINKDEIEAINNFYISLKEA